MATEELTLKINAIDKRSGNQIINDARAKIVRASEDIREVLVCWASDPHRAATDISVNELMQAHVYLATAIHAINNAQGHTE